MLDFVCIPYCSVFLSQCVRLCVHSLLQCLPESVCGVCVRLCVHSLLQCVPEAVCGVCVTVC